MADFPVNGRRLRALVVKEFYQIFKDPSSVLIAFIFPVVLLFIYGFGLSLDLNNINLGLVLEDTATPATSFANSLTSSRYFSMHLARDIRELEHSLVNGTIRGIVVIPSYFTRTLLKNEESAPIQLITDGSEPNTANFVRNYVNLTWRTWLMSEADDQGIVGGNIAQVDPRFWFNEELLSRDFILPGSMAIIMTLIGTLLTSLVITREWERGTFESLMSTPVTIVEIVLGKLIPNYCLGIASMFLCVFVATVLYQVPFRGSLLVLFISSSVFLFAALGMGLYISMKQRNQVAASQIAIIIGFLPAYMLSGFVFEINSMPLPIYLMTYILPARYFVKILQTLFLVGNVWKLIVIQTLCILLIGLFLFAQSVRSAVKRLD